MKYLVLSLDDPGAIVGYVLENLCALIDRRERQYKLRGSKAGDSKDSSSVTA
jgi:hypothetical protein